MDWMYNKNPDKVDPEEYLLGRAIDKNYFKQPSPENYMRSIRSDSSATTSHSHTDRNRKTLEDPLTTLKQKEIEKKKLLLQRTHLKFPDGVPINIITENQGDQPKTLEQLIIESLQTLKYEIDIEKFYEMITEKKKNRKKNRSNSSDSDSKSPQFKKKKRRSSSAFSNDSGSNVSDDSRKNRRKQKNPRQLNPDRKQKAYENRDCERKRNLSESKNVDPKWNVYRKESTERKRDVSENKDIDRKRGDHRNKDTDKKRNFSENKDIDRRRHVDEKSDIDKKKRRRSSSHNGVDSNLSHDSPKGPTKEMKYKNSNSAKEKPNRDKSYKLNNTSQLHIGDEKPKQYQPRKRRADSDDFNTDYKKHESKYVHSCKKNKSNDMPNSDSRSDSSSDDKNRKNNYYRKTSKTKRKSKTPESKSKHSSYYPRHKNRGRSWS